MPKDDKNAILCRMAGNIYLPNKMTYSKYVEDGFKKSLLLANRLTETSPSPNSLLISLSKVDFSSTNGKWYINGEVIVNNNPPVEIKSVTDFGTSWVAESACNNVANAFDEAVGNFVNEVLSNHVITRYIK